MANERVGQIFREIPRSPLLRSAEGSERQFVRNTPGVTKQILTMFLLIASILFLAMILRQRRRRLRRHYLRRRANVMPWAELGLNFNPDVVIDPVVNTVVEDEAADQKNDPESKDASDEEEKH